MLESTLIRPLVHFEISIFSCKRQQALSSVAVLSPSEGPMVEKTHFKDILKFQNVKFEVFHSYIWILNENIQIWDEGSIYVELRL